MGCDMSSSVNVAQIDAKVTPCKRHLGDNKKDKILAAIESDDLIIMALAMEEEKILPTSQISDEGMLWMICHMCCRWDSPHCLEYVLKQQFALNPMGYIDYVNAPTIQGYTCLHLCGIWRAEKCFAVLVQYGGLNLRTFDKMKKTPLQTALDFKSGKILDTLKQLKSLNVEFININTQKLATGSVLEDFPKTKDDQNKYNIKLDKNLYGFTGTVFNFTVEQQQIRQQQTKLQLQKQKIIQEKLKKKEKKKQIKEAERLRKQQEIRKQNQQQQLGDNLIAKLVENVLEISVEEENNLSDEWGDTDEEDRDMTNNLRFKQQQLKQQQELLKKIKDQKMTVFKQQENQKASEIIVKKENQLHQRQQTKQNFLKSHKNQKAKPRVASRVAAKDKRLAPQHEVSGVMPANIQSLYEKAKSKGIFVDDQFPAKNSTIGDSKNHKYSSMVTNLVWLRPSKFLKGEYKLFNGIDPNDIKQGSLGVCYMLATISALAANPKNIQKIFVFHDIQIGFYVLRLYINGQPKHIVVDDLIPCDKYSRTPIFTKPIGKQIWVLLLEKAWAKVIGNYLGAESMTTDHMMEDLSGAPGYGRLFKNEGTVTREQKLQQCIRHDKLGHILVFTSVSDKEIQGIANSHAYSILKTYSYHGKTIFKIRNPWGRFEWHGQYGDGSSLWTPQLKKLVVYESKDDGIFFLSQAQILQAFSYYSVSLIHSQFKYSFLPFQSGHRQDVFFRFSLKSDTQINLRVTQPFQRMVRDPNYKHSPLVFQIGKIQANSVIYIAEGHQKCLYGAKSVHAFPDITKNLSAGDYIVRVRMLWNNYEKYNSAVLGIYANQTVQAQIISPQQGIPLWKLMLIDFCKTQPQKTIGKARYKVVTMKGQFVFPVYSNSEENVTIKFDRAKMNMVDMGQGAISGHELLLRPKPNQPDVGTMIRTEPAKGSSTGKFFITS